MKKKLILVLISFLFLLSGCGVSYSDYNELQDKYSELETKYDEICSEYVSDKEKIAPYLDNIIDKIGSIQDDITTVWIYFEEDDYTFEEARSSFDKIHTVLNSILYPEN